MKKKNYLDTYELQVRQMLFDVFNNGLDTEEVIDFLKAEQLASFRRGRESASRNTKARPKTSPAKDSLPQ